MIGCRLAFSDRWQWPLACLLGWWSQCYMRMPFPVALELMVSLARLRFRHMGWRRAAQGPPIGWPSSPCAGKRQSAVSLLMPQPAIMWTTSSDGPGVWHLPSQPCAEAESHGWWWWQGEGDYYMAPQPRGPSASGAHPRGLGRPAGWRSRPGISVLCDSGRSVQCTSIPPGWRRRGRARRS